MMSNKFLKREPPVFYGSSLYLWTVLTHRAHVEHDAKSSSQDFTGGPLIKNLPCNAGDVGLTSGQETKILYAMGQLSPCATAREKPTHQN